VIARPLVQVWDATGATALGVLADFTSLTISDVFCDLGSLALETPRDTAGASLLDVDEDRQLRLSWPGTSSARDVVPQRRRLSPRGSATTPAVSP
jgi:hypothetical protein